MKARPRAGTESCPYCGQKVRKGRFARHTGSLCEKRPRPHRFAETFERRPVPEWLAHLAAGSELPSSLPLADILRGSCYYPASGLDASPVIILNGFLHSFVFADYSINRREFLEEVGFGGFGGYRRVLARDVTKDELVPHGWTPRMPQYYDEFMGMQRLAEAEQRCEPFGHWSVWRRTDEFGEDHGPALFSFFFISGEATAVFQGLYERLKIAPEAIAIIQPGHAMGGNWTNFLNSDAHFWQTVCYQDLEPEYLLVGEYGSFKKLEPRCPFYGYSFVLRTTTYEPGRTIYTYNADGDTTRWLSTALSESKETGFKYTSYEQSGIAHTIDIFRRGKK